MILPRGAKSLSNLAPRGRIIKSLYGMVEAVQGVDLKNWLKPLQNQYGVITLLRPQTLLPECGE